MLKKAQYATSISRRAAFCGELAESSPEEVVYLIMGNSMSMCVYSGITAGSEDFSTMNAAREVIVAIARQEKWSYLKVGEVFFYDLQTHLGYPGLIQPGKFRFDEVRFGLRPPNGELVPESIRNVIWRPRECFGRIQEFFAEQIGTP